MKIYFVSELDSSVHRSDLKKKLFAKRIWNKNEQIFGKMQKKRAESENLLKDWQAARSY